MMSQFPLRIWQSIPTNWRQDLGAEFMDDGLLYVFIPGVMYERPEIGKYDHVLGHRRTVEFAEFVERQGLWDLPGAKLQSPDQPSVYFNREHPDGRQIKMWTLDDLPSEVITVLDVFHKLVLEATASPVMVVAGEARWLTPTFSAREPLQLEFTLSAKGTQRLMIEDPMASQRRDVQLRLMVMRVRQANRRDPNPTNVNIPPISIARPDLVRVAGGGPGSFLELDPGQQARFTASCSPYLSPGEHQAVLLLDTGGGDDTPRNHVQGVLALELPHIHIVHR